MIIAVLHIALDALDVLAVTAAFVGSVIFHEKVVLSVSLFLRKIALSHPYHTP